MRSILSWFVDNPIASKLVMMIIILSGLMSFPLLDKQFFPQTAIDLIRITVAYPGAGPVEVEKQICARIEEAVQDLGGIEEIRSVAREGIGEVVIEVEPGEDTQRLLNDVKANIDAINTFPAESERPQIVEERFKNLFLRLQLAGDISERQLKELGETIREELVSLPSVAIVELRTPRNYEVGIEVSEQALREYGLRFEDIANAIRSYSLNLPGGKVRDAGGDILLQTRAQANYASDFEQIPLRRGSDASILRVGDVARVVDGFEDVDTYSALDLKPSLELWILNQSNPNIMRTSKAVKAYVEEKSQSLPEGVVLRVWADASKSYQGRLDTLIFNGSGGLLLVFIVLVIFLRPSLAFWVCSGIAVAFLGAMWFLSFTAVSLNVISMFAFIMILGIVVDDAIIVGESVYSAQLRTGDKRLGAIEGTLNVMAPVWFAVLSTMVFFMPFFYVGDGPEPGNIATPVMLALMFSLLESLLLLPSHLGQNSVKKITSNNVKLNPPRFLAIKNCLSWLEAWRQKTSDLLPYFAATYYRNFLLRAISARKTTMMVFAFLFIFAVATLKGGWLPFSFFPRVTSDYISATATMAEAVPYQKLLNTMQHMERAADRLRDQVNTEFGVEVIKGVHATAYQNKVRITALLEDGNERPIGSKELADRFSQEIGELAEVKELSVSFTIFDLPKPLEFVVKSDSQQELEAFSALLLGTMKATDGLYNVSSTLESPSNEINLRLRPEAESLQTTLQQLSRQVRRAFYGEEVQRIPRLREDVKVLVRYPKSDRSQIEQLEQMYIRTGNDVSVPLASIVDIDYQNAYKKVERLDGKRVARIASDVQNGFSPGTIIGQLQRDSINEWKQQFPSITVSLKGEAQESEDFLLEMISLALLSMLGIFALMAVMFRSYWQPVLVLTAIPFGFMGAIFGHVLVGVDLSMFSILGIMACAGVVVNDNVVLIDRINQLKEAGYSVRKAVVEGAVQRFRPIVLTSVTTFLGLTPILLESSVQAQFLIPMVASLSFGVLCATFVTLIFVPTLYLAGDYVGFRISKQLS